MESYGKRPNHEDMDILTTQQNLDGNGRQTLKYGRFRIIVCVSDDPYQTDKTID